MVVSNLVCLLLWAECNSELESSQKASEIWNWVKATPNCEKFHSAEHLIVLRCVIYFSVRPGEKIHLSYLLKALGTAVSPPTRNSSQASENKFAAISYSIHSWCSRHATFNFRNIFFGDWVSIQRHSS